MFVKPPQVIRRVISGFATQRGDSDDEVGEQEDHGQRRRRRGRPRRPLLPLELGLGRQCQSAAVPRSGEAGDGVSAEPGRLGG